MWKRWVKKGKRKGKCKRKKTRNGRQERVRIKSRGREDYKRRHEIGRVKGVGEEMTWEDIHTKAR